MSNKETSNWAVIFFVLFMLMVFAFATLAIFYGMSNSKINTLANDKCQQQGMTLNRWYDQGYSNQIIIECKEAKSKNIIEFDKNGKLI